MNVTTDQFDEVISAFARYNQRPKPLTYEQVKAVEKAARKNNPLHQKALERRRKRKRGGPK